MPDDHPQTQITTRRPTPSASKAGWNRACPAGCG